jgi:hypothetical protein
MLQAGIGPAGAGGPPPGTPQAAGSGQSFSFGLWGDVPYIRSGDAPKMAALLQDLNRAPLAFSVFDGDIKDGSSLCTEDHYAGAIERFNTLAAPLVYVPGDNEWTDCHRTNNGGYNNLERLAYLRRTMFATPESFGQRRLPLEHQGQPGEPYVENTRWVYGGVVFVGLNVPGSNNNRVNTPAECAQNSARTPADCDADNAEYAARDAADVEWLRQAFQVAGARRAPGVMVIMQADPGFDLPETADNEREAPAVNGYTNLLGALVAETRAFAGEVVLVHGDTHFFKVDKPLIDQANLVPNLTRVETFGSPNVHWVRVDVAPGSRTVFTFTPMLVPGN